MKRIDTWTEKAKAIYTNAMKVVEGYETMPCRCFADLKCKECPFGRKDGACNAWSRTPEEWKAWAAEEIKEDNKDEKTSM